MALPLAGIVGVLQRNVNGLSYGQQFRERHYYCSQIAILIDPLPGNKRRKLVLTPVLVNHLAVTCTLLIRL
jgi:hypothetical protein